MPTYEIHICAHRRPVMALKTPLPLLLAAVAALLLGNVAAEVVGDALAKAVLKGNRSVGTPPA
jgi:hypothetical protein